ncbi:MAG: DUF3078 domain-containing protein [Bacteroidota bacterium]|nr:DUF3078 domain-containing protein [Bacteroidota bacterium]HHU96876.1 DUF3078 domain-containing protein [Petrimonas sp.]
MKRIFLSLMAILFSVLTSVAVAMSVMPSPVKVSDTTDVFHEITDIGKRVRQQVARSQTNQFGQPIQTNPPVVLNDTLPVRETASWLIAPPDSLVFSDSTLLPLFVFRNPLDQLYKRKENGTLQLPQYSYDTEAMQGLTFRDTLFYSPLFLPMIFTGQMLPHDLSLYPIGEEVQEKGLLIPMEKTFAPELGHLDFTREVRRHYFLTYPDRIRYSVVNFDSLPADSDGDEMVRETYNPFKELLKAETSFSLETPDVEGATIDRKYWVTSGEHSFQFAHNHFSENWHKGGTNNLNINSYNALRANYKKNKVRFNNLLEWRLQVFNAPDDTLRHYRIGNDMIRYYGDFGVDAFLKGWSYSMNVEAKSQLFNSYPVNSDKLRSTLLSPLYTTVGVGLKYNLDKRSQKVRHRRFRLDLAISPISLSHRYVMSDSVNVTRYGIPEGENTLLDIGTTISSNFTYDITRYITWRCRLNYFTPYDKVVAEIENTLNMALSNAFSTTIYLHVRYDDSVPIDPKFKYWQFNQTLSFGLNYKW